MNELQQLEIETIERQNETFKITNLDQANWAFKKLDAIQAKENEINQLATQEIERIKEWQNNQTEQLQHNKDYFEHILTEYFKEERQKDAKFKLNTPYGKVTARKGSKVIQISNEQNVIDQLEHRGFLNYIKVTKKLNQSDIKKDFNVTENGNLIDSNGELLEGIYLFQKPISYTVKVGD
ncbi:host-nuclease inhibitor Gam family protein [Staphylococcus epidermidis]|uniref:host-nuclease inhibitor Gam family protein n=1 Tax=Staphylococcus epidermidis TaxID=1282 RepID=UPI00188767DD|nr:host-nuclease inhibitor Gam family protein [Staphylococcus epidermidis]MBF2173609.1 host-nuclease inhibitor Gam family protein [Staphylococcus epidermidis]MBF2187539.1 host-nuclease inhibitor Gam family protein [Staphylococcus epidermidis]